MKPQFNTKDEYLTWRAAWRARYQELSADVRIAKVMARATASGLEKDKWNSVRPAVIQAMARFKKTAKYPEFWCPASQLWILRTEARQMMEWRKEAKLRAQELYAAEHQVCSSPA